MTSALSVTQSVNVPRAAFLDFPLGRTAGPPGRPDVQLQIMRQSLALFSCLDKPGQVVNLPFSWSESEGDLWKENFGAVSNQSGESTVADERTERNDQPQYQYPKDAVLAAQGVCETCIWLG